MLPGRRNLLGGGRGGECSQEEEANRKEQIPFSQFCPSSAPYVQSLTEKHLAKQILFAQSLPKIEQHKDIEV